MAKNLNSVCKLGFVLFLFLILSTGLKAQTVVVGSLLEERLKTEQLLGNLPQDSFSLLPFSSQKSLNLNNIDKYLATEVFKSDFLKGTSVSILPVQIKSRFNSHHAYGFNDGAMIPSKGFQLYGSAGVHAKIGPLEVQLNPEWVHAANPSHQSFGDDRNDSELSRYYYFHNTIDMPERFGSNKYQKMFLGQSFVKLNVGPVSAAYSTEHVKFGPGVQNALILGNNAPGFQHITLKSNKPINSPIGAFEFQFLGGRLDNSDFSPLPRTTTSYGMNLYSPANDDWRYLSAFNINYQPKWIPDLYLGFTRTFMAYSKDINTFNDYLPFLVKLQKGDIDQDAYDRDQRLSMYGRLVFPKAHAEVYFEYALNDNAYNIRDFIGSPDHGRAYLFGFSKVISLQKENTFISLNAEVTQLSQTTDRLVRDAGSFYQHYGVREGHTHMGQTIGAGPGTGSNVQGLQVKWLNGYKSLGFLFQRIEQNMDFYEAQIKNLNGMSRKWVDYGIGFTGQWDFKNLIVNAKIQGIQSLNYQWRLKNYDASASYYVPNNDVFNLHTEIGLTYKF